MKARTIRNMALASLSLYGLAMPVLGAAHQQFQAVSLPREIAARPELQHKISHKFGNATLVEVLAWMSLDEVSFVADGALSPSARRLSLEFNSIRLRECMDLVASEVNGRWEKRGDIYMLLPVNGASELEAFRSIQFFTPPPLTPTSISFTFTAQIADQEKTPPAKVVDPVSAPPAQVREVAVADAARAPLPLPSGVLAQAAPAQNAPPAASSNWASQFEARMARIEAQLKRIEELLQSRTPTGGAFGFAPPTIAQGKPDMFFEWKDFADTKQGNAEYKKAMEKFAKDMKGHAFVMPQMDPKAMAEFEKSMEKFAKDSKNFGNFAWPKEGDPAMQREIKRALEESRRAFDDQKGVREDVMRELAKIKADMPKMNAEQRADIERAMAEQKKDRAAMERDFSRMKFEMPKMDPFQKAEMEKAFAQVKDLKGKVFFPQNGKDMVWVGGPAMFKSGATDIPAVIASLTDAQRATLKKRGYLVPSELSLKQKALLGGLPTGKDWSLSYSVDGKKLAVKSK